MFSGVGTNNLDFHRWNPGAQAHIPPRVACDVHRIDAIRNDRMPKPQIVPRNAVSHAIAEVGDIIAIDPQTEFLDNGFICSRHLDDKAGVAVMFAALKALVEAKDRLPVDIYFLFTIEEEVGVGASTILNDNISSLIAIDNGTSAPGQNSAEFGVTVSMADQHGPFDYHLTRKLVEKRIWPAIDVTASGTRKEEKLVDEGKLKRMWALRKLLSKMKPLEGLETLLDRLNKTASNDEFLGLFDPK